MERAEQFAVLGGGCFWCLEAVFEQLVGVVQVVSGYAGGHIAHPSYEQVCGGRTGHAEVVRIHFAPALIDFETLLDIFFVIHDPTTRDRQGNDVGTQYRSVIFCQDAEQERMARAAVARIDASGDWGAAAVTQIAGAEPFYAAEDYHQAYYRLNGHQPYCAMVVAPKVAKFRRRFSAFLKSP